MNKNQPVKYILQDIECWRHCIGKYPVRIDCPYKRGLFLGMAYTAKQFERSEERIKTYFSRQGDTVSIMNPLYQYDGKFETVVTVDIVNGIEKITQSINAEIGESEWFDEVHDLVKRHEKRFDEIFRIGGDVSMRKMGSIYISNDRMLQSIEKRIQSLLVHRQRQEHLLRMMVGGDLIAAKASQWISKDNDTINSLTDMLKEDDLSSAGKNLILRQIIPCFELFSKTRRRKIVYLMQNILYDAVPIVRNKALSVLSRCSSDDLELLSEECLVFIALVSKTKQMNCSYPAREILEKLKSSET